MAIPPLADTDIDQDSPLKTTTVMEALRDRRDYNEADATNGGAGIAPTVAAFLGAFGAHSHDGTDGEGENIDSDGIATDAAFEEDMFQDLCVSAAKIATKTMDTANLANGATVTIAKLAGDLGYAVSGSQAYDTDPGAPLGPNDEVFQGDVAVFPNPKMGTGIEGVGVVCERKPTTSTQIDFFVRSVTNSTIKLGIRVLPPIAIPLSGTWEWSFRLLAIACAVALAEPFLRAVT